MDAFAPRRTHAESIDFIERHPKLIEAIEHIIEEDGSDGKLRKYLGLGYLAALLYLMGASNTPPERYRELESPTEDQLNWDRWDVACDYFVELAQRADSIRPIVEAQVCIYNEGGGTVDEIIALLVKGWNSYAKNRKVVKAPNLHYEKDEEGIKRLVECPAVGGIDYGEPKEATEPIRQEPSPQEIAQRAKKERMAKEAKKAKATPRKKKKPKGKNTPRLGKYFWVKDGAKESWRGKVTRDMGKTVELEVQQGHPGAGSLREVASTALSATQPRPPKSA